MNNGCRGLPSDRVGVGGPLIELPPSRRDKRWSTSKTMKSGRKFIGATMTFHVQFFCETWQQCFLFEIPQFARGQAMQWYVRMLHREYT